MAMFLLWPALVHGILSQIGSGLALKGLSIHMCQLIFGLRGNLNQVQSDDGGSKMNMAIDPLILCGH